ncbi:antibiotic biosynthesis monooxygenase family protein [Nakamurella endophytica]|uniref:ABM domain-containing protein n=1 Tax=Nakamurella endophytica TaxID=1748367 RepID=A0A917T4N5_9ACTN|nr:antibiotic biosynthesis monooxygenase [Nakamurella endophytica]GGM09104.1 hypothetical protein GCM10011594_31270 [Nakamurella endophytica]
MVQFVNCFEVPVGRDDDFLRLWTEVNGYMVTRPGYVNHRLQRSLMPDARYRFVNLAEWRSADDLRAGHDERFRKLATGPAWADFRSTPAMYEIVHSGQRDHTDDD